MSGEALSEAALQAGLHDIRLPAAVAGGQLAELAAAVALAGVAALMIGLLARPFLVRKKIQPQPSLAEQLSRLDTLPEPERRIGLLHLLKSHDPSRFADIRDSLYRPETAPQTAELRAALMRHA